MTATIEDAPALVPADEIEPAIRERQFKIVRELENAGVFKATQLDLDGMELPYVKAELLAAFLGTVKRRSSWYLGDLLIYGEKAYGESYAQLAHATGIPEQSLLNLAYVSRNVPPERRVANLGHSVHAAVAPLQPKEQIQWLKQAEKHGWKRDELRAAMKAKRKDDKPPLFDDEEDGGGPLISHRQLLEVAQDVLRAAVPDANGEFVLIPVEAFVRLRTALGEEE